MNAFSVHERISGFRLLLRRLSPDRLEVVVLAFLAGAIAYQLFCEPVVGMANNADFARLISPAGISYKSSAEYWETVFRFSETKFVFVAPAPFRYLTSERPILAVALVLNRLISKDGRFDVRVLGFCNLVLYLGAIAIFLRAFRGQGVFRRLFVAAAVLLMCVDVKWVAYFNSFYCESASLIFLFSTLGLALVCAGEEQRGRAAWFGWFGYMISAFLFWMAKSQNTAFAPCLALGAWYFFPSTKHPVLRLIGTAAIPLCILGTFAIGAYAGTTGENVRAVLNEEIFPNSHTLKDDRQELGVDRGGASLYHIGSFYVHHPVRWWQMAQRRAREAFDYIPYGNFDRASGLGANAQSQAFNSWSEFKKAHYPRNLNLLICLFVAYSLLAGIRAGWLDHERAARTRTLIGLVLAFGCALEFVATVTFEANGTAKHLFIYNVAVDLCLLLAVIDLCANVVVRAAERIVQRCQ